MSNELGFSKLIKTIGIIIFCIVMYSVPVLIACSFCLDWDDGLQFMLSVFGIIQLGAFIPWIYMEADK